MGLPISMATDGVQIQISDVAKAVATMSPRLLAGLTWGELELTLGH